MNDAVSDNSTPATLGRTSPSSPQAAPVNIPPQLAAHPRYRVLKMLGEGGMGAVYLAEHIKMGRRVALKVMRAGLLGNAMAVQRFQQEVKAASQLSHPHIVTAHDADDAGDSTQLLHFLVMEFVEGETLAAYLKRKGPLPADEACRYVRQAALGLQHAFEKGMVHRDIKPDNLILTKTRVVKILDFGLARLGRADDDPRSDLTGQNMLMGTVDYMAPEQAGDSHGVDIRADIYSLGCTLYQLLTGEVPFPSGTLTERLLQHADKEPRDLRARRPDIPEALAAIVRKMLAKKPEQRFATPVAVAAALEPFTRKVAPQKLPPAQAPRKPISWHWAGASIVAAALIAWGVWKLIPSKRDAAATNPQAEPIAATSTLPALSAKAGASSVNSLPLSNDIPNTTIESGEFSEVHGADKSVLQKWFIRMQSRGFLPICLNAQVGSIEPRFNSVAVRDTRGKSFLYDLDMKAQPGDKPPQTTANPIHAITACAYWVGKEVRHAHVRCPDTVAYTHYWFLDLAKITPNALSRVELNLKRPVSFYVFATYDKVLRAFCLFGPSMLKWNLNCDLTPEKLRENAPEIRKRGSRAELLSVYANGDTLRFALQEVENPEQLEWTMVVDMPQDVFEKVLKENLSRGMRPNSIVSSGPLDKPSYSCIWVQTGKQ